MSFIDSLEHKFGRFAIPNLIRVLAGFQLLSWLLIHYNPTLLDTLMFDSTLIKQGEVWRLFSYIVVPRGLSLIWVLFISFQFMLSDGLEQAWGAFRVNLYLLAGIFFVALGGMIFDLTTTGIYLWGLVIMAFAMHFPNEEILLYFIIPLKMKWIGWITAAGAILGIVTAPDHRAEIIFSLLNFVFAFAPAYTKGIQRQAAVATRRQRFDEGKPTEAEPLHRCSVCGRTDGQNKYLEFRVNANGDDVCNECRAAAKG